MTTLFHTRLLAGQPATLLEALESIHAAAAPMELDAMVTSSADAAPLDIKAASAVVASLRDAVVRDLGLHDKSLTARGLMLLGLVLPVEVVSAREGPAPGVVTFFLLCRAHEHVLTVPVKIRTEPDEGDRDMLGLLAPALAVFMKPLDAVTTMEAVCALPRPKAMVKLPGALDAVAHEDVIDAILAARRAFRAAGFRAPRLGTHHVNRGPSVDEWMDARVGLAEAAGELQNRIEAKLDAVRAAFAEDMADVMDLVRRHHRVMGMMMLDPRAAALDD